MASAWGDAFGGAWGDAWGDVVTVYVPVAVPKVNRPSIRSIDAKSIADRFNQGQPDEADYTWPSGRKFYQ